MTSKNTLLIIMGICLVAVLLVAGCTQPTAPAPAKTLTPTPAATDIGYGEPGLSELRQSRGYIRDYE